MYSKNICFYVFITNNCFNFFWNMFYSERIKKSNVITFNVLWTSCAYIQSNPMSSNIRVLTKIYYISSILYFGDIISRITTIKSSFILITFFISKLVRGWGGIKNSFCFHNQLLQSFHQLYLFLYLFLLYLFLNLLKYFLINVHLMCLITY